MRETYTRQKQPSADGLQNRCFPVKFVKFSEHLFFWQDDNAWLRNCRSSLVLMKKEIKVRKRETGRKMFGEQFINNKEPSHTLKDRTFFFTTLAKKFIIQFT